MKEWLSVHLYYAEPWEGFLSNDIAPFVEKMVDDHLAEAYFFIRYWHKGPHIRLRIKSKSINTNRLQNLVSAYFEKFFIENPSHPINSLDTENPEKAEVDAARLPNNSFHFIPYHRETERYGGEAAIAIAERQFGVSSRVVLSIIKECEAWNYNKALGKAMYLHLAFAYATDMSLAEAALFFNRIFEIWLPRTSTSEEAFYKNKDVVLKAFRENYEAQKVSILPLFEKLWLAMKNDSEFEQNWLMDWISDTKQIRKDLCQIQSEKKFIMPKWFTIDHTSAVDISHQERWAVYGSYIHMTNNRLGILNRDEGYLGYVMMHGFSHLKEHYSL